MKNYNRRGLMTGIVQIFLSVFCLITMIVTSFDVKLAILGIIIAILGITSVINSFSKEAARKELIDNEDERSQLVEMKAKAKTLDIVSNFLFFATAAAMMLDGELRETQTADYFSKHRRSDCAVRELTAR